MLGSPMRIGVPKEIKTQEFRVGMTPSGVAILVSHGHTVLLEQGAGLGSSIPDEAYVKAGAKIVSIGGARYVSASPTIVPASSHHEC